MEITTEQIKALRDSTGISVMQCKKALEEAGGDTEKALIVLRKKSGDIAMKKSDRTLGAGIVAAYIHGKGNVGTMVELRCESDFVAQNDEFKRLAYDIAMHVAAANPEFLREEDITPEAKTKVREVLANEVASSDKSPELKEKMLSGKVESYFKEKVLLNQPFIKNPEVTVATLIDQAVQKFGEKTELTRFVRFSA